MLDTLGFKGIWKRWPAAKILRNLGALQSIAKVHATKQSEVHILFLSDTVLVSNSAERLNDWFCLSEICTIVQILLRGAADLEPTLLYRGCVGIGDFLVHEDGMLGPAIDMVAECEKRAEGAFVWLLPTARDIYRIGLKEMASAVPPLARGLGQTCVNYSVPLKGGSSLDTVVTNPLAPLPAETVDAGQAQAALKRMRKGFGEISDNIEVEVKRENTAKFLAAALQSLISSAGTVERRRHATKP